MNEEQLRIEEDRRRSFLGAFKRYWSIMRPRGGEDIRLAIETVTEACEEYYRRSSKLPTQEFGGFFSWLMDENDYFLIPRLYSGALAKWNVRKGRGPETSQPIDDDAADVVRKYLTYAPSLADGNPDSPFKTIEYLAFAMLATPVQSLKGLNATRAETKFRSVCRQYGVTVEQLDAVLDAGKKWAMEFNADCKFKNRGRIVNDLVGGIAEKSDAAGLNPRKKSEQQSTDARTGQGRPGRSGGKV